MRRAPRGRRINRKPRKRLRWIIPVILLVAVVGVAGFGVRKAADWINGPDDYQGQGSGSVVVQIPEGANGQQIADVLHEADVVKSSEAFYQLSLNDERAQEIQPGFYQLREHMSAQWALRELSDDANRVEGNVVVREGARISDIIDEITAKTDIDAKDLKAALDEPESLGLPPEARGNPEGYLFPATYTVKPGTSATKLLARMVHKAKEVENDINLARRAKTVDLNKEEVLIMASILEYEANRSKDYPKVARVLFNRLDDGMPLQLDSTVTYISDRKGDVWTTEKERKDPSAYNTYKHKGLPPGPIGSPGKETIEAVLDPAKGSWRFFVTDFEHNKTVFSTTLADHEKAVERSKEYCRTHDDC